MSAESVAPLASGLLVFGQARVRFTRARDGAPRVVDSTFAGVMLRGAEAPLSIGRPLPALAVTDARVALVAPDLARVVFVQPPDTTGADVELFTALVGPNGWSALQSLGKRHKASRFSHQMASELVRFDGALWFAAAQRLPVQREGVFLVTLAGDSVQSTYVDLGLAFTTYVALAAHDGSLWMVVSGNRLGDSGTDRVWLSRKGENGWTTPIQVGGDGIIAVAEPKLFSSSDGLVVSWTEEAHMEFPRDVMLTWRGVSAESSALVHRRRVRWPLVVGESPFAHLLSVRIDDSTSTLLELRPSGARELATIPGVHVAPVITGTHESPVAIGMIPFGTSAKSPQVVIFDLRCAAASMNRLTAR